MARGVAAWATVCVVAWAWASVASVAASAAATGGDVVLKPIKSGGAPAALVFVQDSQVPPAAYTPLLAAVQAAYPNPLWVAVPAYAGDTATAATVGAGVDRVLSTMAGMGLEVNATAMFYGGHGAGGFAAQDWLNATYTDAQYKPAGQLLFGSFLRRGYFNSSWRFPVATLTVGGGLDGVVRVTRIAEAYLHQFVSSSAPFTTNVRQGPVVVNEGQSHWQFASGTPTPEVQAYDLKPEVSDEEARAAVATSATAFMLLHAGDASQLGVLVGMVNATQAFVGPIVEAFQAEGSYHIKPPCYNNPPSDKCQVGSPWIVRAQQLMGGPRAAAVTWEATNQFHPVYQIPFHLPHVFNNCTSATAQCKLNCTTVAQNMYNSNDTLDTGLYPVSAYEMRAKMNSRQAIEIAVGFADANFSVTDGPSLCAEINNATFETWAAMPQASVRQRFASKGEPMLFGPDIGPLDIGPLWIWTPMQYTQEAGDDGGLGAVNVTSPMLKTPVKYWLSIVAGFHYCKVLSPARALEWLYVDSLRLHASLSGTPHFPSE